MGESRRRARSSELLDQGPPRNVEAEKAVLGCILLDRSLIEKIPLEPSDFHVEAHSILYAHLQQYPHPGAVDVHLFLDWLREAGDFDSIGGAAYLAELTQSVGSVHNVLYYVENVKRAAERRAILGVLLDGVQSVHNPQVEPGEIAEDLQSRFGYIRAGSGIANRGGLVIRLADVSPQPICWLWPGRIALGKLTLLAGDPNLGKSLLTLDVVARVTRGLPWPDDADSTAPLGGAVLLSAEDDVADTIRPRLDAARADVSRVVQLTAIVGHDSDGSYSRPVDLSRDLSAVAAAVQGVAGCKLVVIDPVTAYLGRTDDSSNAEIRGLLAPLAELAGRHHVAVIAVTHLRKAAGPAMYRSMGSLAFTAAARAAWAVAPDRENHGRRLLLPLKNNLAADVLGLAFQVVGNQEHGIPILAWEPGPVEITADQALNGGCEDHEETREATAWLHETLSEAPVGAAEVQRGGRANGYSPKVLRRALAKLGGKTRKRAFGGGWEWCLEDALEDAEGAQDSRARERASWASSRSR